MNYNTFTWTPIINPEGNKLFRKFTAQFGDGYAQEAGDGINNEVQTWPLQFVGYDYQIRPINDFLRAHGGIKPFKWTPPMGEEGLYVCGEFNIIPQGWKVYSLSATFNQRFVP